MRVAFVHHSGDLYGSSKSLLYLLGELRKRGVIPLVILAEDGPLHQVLADRGIEVRLDVTIPVLRRRMFRSCVSFFSYFSNFVRSIPRLRRILREHGIEIVHSNDLVIGLAPGLAARSLNIPHVWHVRSNLSEFSLFSPLLRLLIMSLATAIIGVSQSVVRQMGAADSKKLRRVYNGLPPEIINRQLPFDDGFRRRHGFATDDLIICCVGRINGWKGQGFLARAYASLAPDLPARVKLLFVGDTYPGSEFYQSELDDLIDRLGIRGRTTQISFVTDVRSVYEAIDILVVPSVIPEPFGLVVVEGMAYGCPVVAANHGGPAEILRNGETGLLYEPDDLEGLAGRIRELAADDGLRRELGDNARRFMEHAFSVGETADRVYEIYQACLTAGSRDSAGTGDW